jgi:hypothetical protein
VARPPGDQRRWENQKSLGLSKLWAWGRRGKLCPENKRPKGLLRRELEGGTPGSEEKKAGDLDSCLAGREGQGLGL